jgi:hypothetical protein|eukprot:COSAG02_NODE_198_length_29564_cov_12.279009_24_plen_182_part_00
MAADLGATARLGGGKREPAADDWLHAVKRRRLAFVSAVQQDDEAGGSAEDARLSNTSQAQEAEVTDGTALPCRSDLAAVPVSVDGAANCVLTTVPDGAVDSESSAHADELVLLSWLASTRPWSTSNHAVPPAAAVSPRRILQVSGDGIAAIGTAALLGDSVQAVVLSAPHLAGRRESQQPL